MGKSRLGKSGINVSKLGLGTVQFGLDYGFTKKKNQEQVDVLLSFADKNGISLIDTARSYGDSENKIGNYIAQNKNNLIIATKLEKISAEDALSKNKLKKVIYSSIEESMKCLRVGKLEILQLHQTDDYLIKNGLFWDIIFQAKEEELFGSLGVSVYEVEESTFLIDHYKDEFDFFQIPYNVFDRRFEKIEKVFIDNKIGIISRSTFLKGIITCKTEALPPELKELKGNKGKLDVIANKLSLEVPDLALLYVYNKEFISSTILGVDTVKELEQNILTVDRRFAKENMSLLDEVIIYDLRLIDPRKWISI